MNLEADSARMGIPMCFLIPLVALAWAVVIASCYGLLGLIVSSTIEWWRKWGK